ncbi:hypothetical protein J4E91_002101 [Alternaria rosae]|nr:hypothetical protein J4E91_002101 [Alternaria rosae]
MFSSFSTKLMRRKRYPIYAEDTGSELQHLTQARTSHPEPLNSFRSKFITGWRFGVINCAVAALIVFVINLIATITWASNADSGVLFKGNCDRARKLNSVLHIIINVLSTILLSSSNYVMQCLSAPTRKEVDIAHAQAQWLDVGVLSVRNLYRISKKRVFLWSALALSSLPLHLLYVLFQRQHEKWANVSSYNSVVYLSLVAYSYEVYGVRENFINSPDCLGCVDPISGLDFDFTQEIHQKLREKRFEKLDNVDCIDAYATTFQSNRGDLLLVAKSDDIEWKDDQKNNEDSAVFWRYSFESAWEYEPQDTFEWMCSGVRHESGFSSEEKSCDAVVERIRNSAQNWTIAGDYEDGSTNFGFRYMKGPIQYCLRENIESDCRVLWSVPIASLVTGLNLLKAMLILYTALRIREQPLMTMGDAIVSFLQQPDSSTMNMCLASSKNIRSAKSNFIAGPKRWKGRKYKWKDTTSLTRRVITFVM